MSASILESLSGKKLLFLVISFLVCQLVCFLIGGLLAPQPSSTDKILGSKCLLENNTADSWAYIRGKGKCEPLVNILNLNSEDHAKLANQIVFSFQIPSPKEGINLDYSRWQQNLVGLLDLEIVVHPDYDMPKKTILTFDVKMGYRNKGDAENDWKLYASSREERILQCDLIKNIEGYPYNCSVLPLFELGSLYHDYYLINIRIPVNVDKHINTDLGHLDDMWLVVCVVIYICQFILYYSWLHCFVHVVINQTGGFTKVWMSLKIFFLPVIVGVLIWFWNRVHNLQRSPSLLEYMLMILGASLTFLNLPVELLTLCYELPFMLLFSDIRQGIFLATLLSFWIVFAAEHMMDYQGSTFKTYWRHLSGVGIACIALLIFDLCERGVHISNPFYSIWVTDFGTKLAIVLLIIGSLSVGVYFMVLCWMIWKVFCNLRAKKTSLPVMSQARRLHYTGIVYRFNFLMVATVICAALTLIAFTLGQLSEGQWKWDDHQQLEYSSAFFTGVYGMWNIYIFALLVLYAPSHKKWPSHCSTELTPVVTDMEFSRTDSEPCEISSLTTFIRKTAFE